MPSLFRAPAMALACLALLAGIPAEAPCADAQAFNPYLHSEFPNSRKPKGEAAEMLRKLGGRPHDIAAEAGWRRHWREEAYPVLFGDARAPHEILVMIDFASPKTRAVWAAVKSAMAKLDPAKAKVVLFSDSKELYAYDMAGLVLWANINRKKGAETLDWALAAWDKAKAKSRGRKFVSEYDSVSSSTELPMVFQGMRRLGVPESQECDVADYAYEAGNVNMFQTGQAMRYYGVKSLPAVVADGRVIDSPSADAIVKAVQ